MEVQIEKSIRKQLLKNNCTQNQLAKRIGIRPSTLHAYLNGVVPKGLNTLIKIAQEFNLSLDELVFNENLNASIDSLSVSETGLIGLLGKYELVISKIK